MVLTLSGGRCVVLQHVAAGGGGVQAAGAGQLFAQARSPVAKPDLDARLSQLGALCELLPRVDVRVLRPFERLLELVQLLRSERGAAAPLLPLQGNPRLRLAIRALARFPCQQMALSDFQEKTL